MISASWRRLRLDDDAEATKLLRRQWTAFPLEISGEGENCRPLRYGIIEAMYGKHAPSFTLLPPSPRTLTLGQGFLMSLHRGKIRLPRYLSVGRLACARLAFVASSAPRHTTRGYLERARRRDCGAPRAYGVQGRRSGCRPFGRSARSWRHALLALGGYTRFACGVLLTHAPLKRVLGSGSLSITPWADGRS